MGGTDSPIYCADQVRRYDPDRYLASLFAPEDRRAGLLALYAFNLEIARTREIVSEPMLGEIRLQWWRETIDGIYDGEARDHAVATALSAAVNLHALSRAQFTRLIDGRSFDLTDQPPQDLASLENYAEATSSALIELSLEVLGARNERTAEAARHAGIAWCLTGLLRTLPFHARAGRIYLPESVMRDAGITVRSVLSLQPSDGLVTAAARLADVARTHLDAARALRPQISRDALPALLPLTLADAALKRLARAGYDVFGATTEMARPVRQLRLTVAAWRGRY